MNAIAPAEGRAPLLPAAAGGWGMNPALVTGLFLDLLNVLAFEETPGDSGRDREDETAIAPVQAPVALPLPPDAEPGVETGRSAVPLGDAGTNAGMAGRRPAPQGHVAFAARLTPTAAPPQAPGVETGRSAVPLVGDAGTNAGMAGRRPAPQGDVAFAAGLTPTAAPPQAPGVETGRSAVLLVGDAGTNDELRAVAARVEPSPAEGAFHVAPIRVGAPQAPSAAPETGCAGTERPPEVYENPAAARSGKTPAIHELTVRIPTPGTEQSVDIRVSERGGEIRVAVRASDPALTDSLRQSLPELSAGFERAGYRSEIWTPGTAHDPGAGDGESRRQRREAFRSRAPGGRRTGEAKWHPPFSL